MTLPFLVIPSILITFFNSPILDVTIGLILVTLVLIARDRITGRLALRNVSRRKATVLIVILGLFIGTGMISGSLVTSDTLNTVVAHTAFSAFGAVDEGIYHSQLGSFSLFTYSTYEHYRTNLSAIPNVVGVTPMIIWSVSLFDSKTRVGQSGVTLLGVYPNSSLVLGYFKDTFGNVISSDIGNNGIILNEAASKDLNASLGDSIIAYSGQNQSAFVIKGIDNSFDRSGFPCCGDHAVITLPAAQSLIGAGGKLNFIAITNRGGIDQSIAYTHQVGEEANSTLSGQKLLYAFGDKNATVVSLQQAASGFSSIFVVLSSFTILAGSVLIVNIFIMLAEERKKEMGMARAVGMKRRHLTKLFLFEGMQYSLASSIIGVFAGIGLAYAIVYALGTLLISILPDLSIGVILQSFTVTPTTLVTSFGTGFLITYLTILFASWRVSRLNIIRAIRGTPEPPHSKRTYTKLMIAGVGTVIFGIFLFFVSRQIGNPTLFLMGPALSILGAGFVLAKFVESRWAFTSSAIASLIYWVYPFFSWENPARPPLSSTDITPFIIGGCFMVISSVLLVAFNTHIIMKGIALVFRSRPRLVPIFQIGMSYPGNKKFRTAVTIFLFALVMFTVIGISIMTNLSNEQNSSSIAAASGGYDLIAFSENPILNLEHLVRSDSNVSSSIQSFAAFSGGYTLVTDLSVPKPNSSLFLYVGANSSSPSNDNFFQNNRYNMTSAMSEFLLSDGGVNIAKVWDDVEVNPNDVVFSTSSAGPGGPTIGKVMPGDELGITLPNGTITHERVIAIMNGATLEGVITTAQTISNDLHMNGSSYALVTLVSSSNANNIAISLKRDFLSYGLQVEVLQTTINQILATQESLFSIFQGFLGLGLIVGIAGLSIIAVRSVVERRQEIGMLRALGFTRSMVLGSFLLENSFVALLGILIGALVAIAFGFAIINSGVIGQVPYVVPWLVILEICAGAYFAALLGTSWSAPRASRILPAQALRYTE